MFGQHVSDLERKGKYKVKISVPLQRTDYCLRRVPDFKNTETNIPQRSARLDDQNGIQILVVRSSDQKSIIGTRNAAILPELR